MLEAAWNGVNCCIYNAFIILCNLLCYKILMDISKQENVLYVRSIVVEFSNCCLKIGCKFKKKKNIGRCTHACKIYFRVFKTRYCLIYRIIVVKEYRRCNSITSYMHFSAKTFILRLNSDFSPACSAKMLNKIAN